MNPSVWVDDLDPPANAQLRDLQQVLEMADRRHWPVGRLHGKAWHVRLNGGRELRADGIGRFGVWRQDRPELVGLTFDDAAELVRGVR